MPENVVVDIFMQLKSSRHLALPGVVIKVHLLDPPPKKKTS